MQDIQVAMITYHCIMIDSINNVIVLSGAIIMNHFKETALYDLQCSLIGKLNLTSVHC